MKNMYDRVNEMLPDESERSVRDGAVPLAPRALRSRRRKEEMDDTEFPEKLFAKFGQRGRQEPGFR